MTQVITASELKNHNTKKSVWIVIKNDVYDVTSYLNEHPGGEDPLLDAAGQDATTAFEDVGHSEDARTLMRKYKIGSLAKGESCTRLRPRKWMSSSKYHRNCTESDASRKMTPRSSKRALSPKPSQKIPTCLIPDRTNSKAALPIPRVPSIVVPRQRRGEVCRKVPPQPPQSGSKLKWAILALAAAIIVGVAYKKYVAK